MSRCQRRSRKYNNHRKKKRGKKKKKKSKQTEETRRRLRRPFWCPNTTILYGNWMDYTYLPPSIPMPCHAMPCQIWACAKSTQRKNYTTIMYLDTMGIRVRLVPKQAFLTRFWCVYIGAKQRKEEAAQVEDCQLVTMSIYLSLMSMSNACVRVYVQL